MNRHPERFTVRRTREGGAIVLLDGHRMTSGDAWTADQWNDVAIYWSHAQPGSRAADVALLAAQYLYADDREQLDNVRPTCTHGTIGTGFCPTETERGSLYCSRHATGGDL